MRSCVQQEDALYHFFSVLNIDGAHLATMLAESKELFNNLEHLVISSDVVDLTILYRHFKKLRTLSLGTRCNLYPIGHHHDDFICVHTEAMPTKPTLRYLTKGAFEELIKHKDHRHPIPENREEAQGFSNDRTEVTALHSTKVHRSLWFSS
ncbi:hypothetical protein DL98DRAFT_589325 [Cadophora sp. DSE1049]|nr:hypothetical protein DL98DRAFT_589325 [Cadophora sp. DSE1049]